MPDELRERLQAALGSSYTLERELSGGMSRVFVATEASLSRRVVVKVLPPERTYGVNADRFRREIQVAAQLQHPHIVPVLSAGWPLAAGGAGMVALAVGGFLTLALSCGSHLTDRCGLQDIRRLQNRCRVAMPRDSEHGLANRGRGDDSAAPHPHDAGDDRAQNQIQSPDPGRLGAGAIDGMDVPRAEHVGGVES
jgi:hypothetical protein